MEHFLFERYLLFTKRKGQIYVGVVHHKPYEVSSATVIEIDDGLLESAGVVEIDPMPELAHYSKGVDVEVFSINRA